MTPLSNASLVINEARSLL